MRHPLSLFIVTIGLSVFFVTAERSALAQPSQTEEALEELDSEPQMRPAESTAPRRDTSLTSKSESGGGKLKVTKIKPSEQEESSDLYLRQIQRIESQVNELKEEIFRSRTRLAILKESVLASGLSGTQLRIIHRNEMGANFKLIRAIYQLDEETIQTLTLGDDDDSKEEVIYDAGTTPGNHQLVVEMVYRGNGFGVFSYLQTFQFTVSDAQVFRAEDGKRVVLTAIGYERGGITLRTEDRPALRINIDLEDLDEQESKGQTNTPKANSQTDASAP